MIAIAIDDEPVALDIIRTHATKVTGLHLEQTFLSATQALTYLNARPVDVVFVDINMPDLSGLEFAARVQRPVQIIFTTAYPEHALQGFDLAATDYLLKPINFNRFLQACQLAASRLQPAASPKPAPVDALFVKDGYNWVQIRLKDIVYLQAQDNYVSIVEHNRHTLTRITLSELQSRLPAEQFIRVHKSYVVALSQIIKIEPHQVLAGQARIPLSRSYRDVLWQRLSTGQLL